MESFWLGPNQNISKSILELNRTDGDDDGDGDDNDRIKNQSNSRLRDSEAAVTISSIQKVTTNSTITSYDNWFFCFGFCMARKRPLFTLKAVFVDSNMSQ